ncbi:MAG: hydrogenase formation protein HypD [Methanosarcinaceae archaeon]|nr:hydrogenase formation protein HypD [Methanosarcinaceae archaeon]
MAINIKEIQEKLIKKICEYKETVRIMHICGTHERTIVKHGLRHILPKNIKLLSGPGCPVCVTPIEDIDFAIALAESGIVVSSFGDMFRVPGTSNNLFDVKSNGATVKMVYGINDAIKFAKNNPERQVVFFGIGFETTAPMNAVELLKKPPKNFSIISSHKIVPPAMDLLISDISVDAFIAPGHVSTIIGTYPYKPYADKGFPIVVAGFEAYDLLLSIYMILKQIQSNSSKVENAYPRAVCKEGNLKAQELVNLVFEVVDSNWRGIGVIEKSGLGLKNEFKEFDAISKYSAIYKSVLNNIKKKGTNGNLNCMCAMILTAKADPTECSIFGTECTPKNPVGPCMVSMEGTCYNWYKYSKEGTIAQSITENVL